MAQVALKKRITIKAITLFMTNSMTFVIALFQNKDTKKKNNNNTKKKK